MGGSLGKSKKKGKNSGTFKESVWGGQAPYLQNMYGDLNQQWDRSAKGMNRMAPGASKGMSNIMHQSAPFWRNQMAGGAYSGLDLNSAYSDALKGGGNEQDINEMIMGGAGNDYVDAMQDQMQSESDKRLGRDFAMSDARAAGVGQSGSSRHGLLQARLAEDERDRLGDVQTKLGYETFDRDLDRKMDIARRADQFDMGRLQNVSSMIGGKQGAMFGGLGYGRDMQNLNMGQFAPYMAPWQAAGMYSDSMGRPTVLGSGGMSGSTKGKGFGIGGGKRS